MDEYIKKSDLKAELLRRDFYPAIVKSALETMPPADVVPRAMIAEIFGEIEELAKIYTFPVVKNGVVEIVKEPFGCIEPSDLADLKKKYTEGK